MPIFDIICGEHGDQEVLASAIEGMENRLFCPECKAPAVGRRYTVHENSDNNHRGGGWWSYELSDHPSKPVHINTRAQARELMKAKGLKPHEPGVKRPKRKFKIDRKKFLDNHRKATSIDLG